MRTGPGHAQPVTVYKREYVDVHLPPDQFSALNAAAHAELDAKIGQHKAIKGDSEDVLNAAQDVETEAVDDLVWMRRARVMDDDQANAIIISVIDALDDIHPNARLANAGAV
jgi:hypothetical protein